MRRSPPSHHMQQFACARLFCVISAFLFTPLIMPFVYAQGLPYPVEIERITLADPSGQPLNDCRSNEGGLVMIAVTLKNLSDATQPAAAIIVELEDSSRGVTQFVQWQTMTINPNAEQQMAVSFDPSSLSPSGQYDAKVLVWNNVLTPVPLGSPLKIPISC